MGMSAVRSVGGLEVSVLVDASGPFFESRHLAFPDATAVDWVAAEQADPGAFGVDGNWNLNFHCFVVFGPGRPVMLVDTGVGPEGSPAASWAPVPGRLPEELAALGLDAADVDLVVQTHLHSDHVGWAVDSDGVPMFPNARYVVQRDEVAALTADRSPLLEHVVEPLRVAGQLHEVEGRVQLVGGSDTVTAVPTPGHTPGHQSVRVESGAGQVVITGDVLVHAVQLINPDVSYRHEADQDLARETRKALLAQAADQGATLTTAHLIRPFVRA
jgi:glyoxylase-like metal-dependent hydrolase (beta-lactamase superfamily II)